MKIKATLVSCLFLLCALLLVGCSGGSSSSSAGGAEEDGLDGTTSGPTYSEPQNVTTSTFDASTSKLADNVSIDTTTCTQGYVGASAQATSRLKLLVTKDDMSYNYDMPQDGTPIIAPINMGSGNYKFQVMQNTSGSSYVEVASTQENVQLESEFAPFLHPNIFCDFTSDSECVKRAFELAADAENEGDVVRAIYDFITSTITYDKQKAQELANTTGYIPNPDHTYETQSGICFDYASLAAAMFRSLGIPCQIVTGYVSPTNLYHAWNMIYIDGQWVSAAITVEPDEWTRIDLTFASAGNSETIGDGKTYTDRYIY